MNMLCEPAVDLRDPDQFDRAYREHRARALSAVVRILHDDAAAEDVVQEVFTQLWRNPGGFDPSRGPLSTYVSVLARSRALDHWRMRAVRQSTGDRFARSLEAEPRTADSAAESVARREDAALLLEALAGAPDEQREAVLLAYGGGLTAKQIAGLRQLPVPTAKSRIRLGLQKARTALEAA